MHIPIPAPLCACGCGAPVSFHGRKPKTYKKGHHRRKHGFKSDGTFCTKLAHENERLYRLFGLTKDQISALLAAQSGVCAICGTPDPGKSRNGLPKWCLDHCHKSGIVRGVLCHACNAALGLFHDDTQNLKRAFDYLGKNHAIETC